MRRLTCSTSDCIYDGQTLTHGSMLTAADGCNACVCNDGSVDCTNAPGCGQGNKINCYDPVLSGAK